MQQPFPYVKSPGPLIQAIEQLRKSFPSTVTADYLKQVSIAPQNESFVINTLRFLGLIDDNDAKVNERASAFFLSDEEFKPALAEVVREAYSPVFDTFGETAWDEPEDKLISYFRQRDSASDTTGRRKAKTFMTLAELAGKAQPNITASGSATATPRVAKAKAQTRKKAAPKSGRAGSKPPDSHERASPHTRHVDLAVKVEVNLPATSDQAVYDAIFKSLRNNLINDE